MTNTSQLPPLPPLAPSPPRAITVARLHLWLYRISRGRIANRLPGRRFLMLTTTGRKSGARYAVALEYHTDGGTPYLIASNFGHDYPPAWLLNLQANPTVEVERDGRRYWATARVVSPEDRTRIWPTLVREAFYYGRYQQGTAREIPLVWLHPLS